MVKRLFIATLLAVFLTVGCSTATPDIQEPAVHSYPQQQTQKMTNYFNSQGCDIYGAYHHPGTNVWIMWGKCENTPVCDSFIASPAGIVSFESCGEGYEAYMMLCKDAGDCI